MIVLPAEIDTMLLQGLALVQKERFMCTEIKSDWAFGEAADFYIKLLSSESQFQNADSNLTLLNLLTDASSLC